MNKDTSGFSHSMDFLLSVDASVADIEQAITERIDAKKRIETQLSDDRAQMAEERSVLIRKGLNARAAQITATANTDHGWRESAKAALRFIDCELPKLKQRAHQMRASNPSAAPARLFEAVALRPASAEDLAVAMAELARSSHLSHVISFDGAVVVVHRPRTEGE